LRERARVRVLDRGGTRLELRLRHAKEEFTFRAERTGDGLLVALPDREPIACEATPLQDGAFRLRLAGAGGSPRPVTLACAKTNRGIEVSVGGRCFVFQETEVGSGDRSAKLHGGELTAPMVGVVAEVLVAEGDAVAAYQPLLVLEAMKVMSPVEAPFAGRVSKLSVSQGERVEHGQILVKVEAAELP
jgi:biotin carboxyl carrier protein